MTVSKPSTKTSAFGTSGRVNHDASGFYDSKLYRELGADGALDAAPADAGLENLVDAEIVNTTILGSAENMAILPDNSVHLMITSPPYNVSKEYDEDLSLSDYLNLLKNVFRETYRVLVVGGRACINVANLGRKPYIPLTDYIVMMMRELHFNMRGEIIWNKAASASASTAWGSWQSASNPTLRDVHEYILVFSKGDYARVRKNKEVQKNTIDKQEFMDWTKSIWTFNAESAKKIGHPAPFPIELPYRLIQLYSFATDLVLDPFMGSGTTAIAALKSNRNFIGFELDKNYIELIKTRIAPYSELKLFS